MDKEERISYLAFSPNGEFVAAVSGPSVTIWRASDGREVAHLSHELTHPMEPGVERIAFSPDRKYAAALGIFHARIWEINTGCEIARIERQANQESISLRQDGRYLMLGSDLWIWRTDDLLTEACSRLTRNLTLEE